MKKTMKLALLACVLGALIIPVLAYQNSKGADNDIAPAARLAAELDVPVEHVLVLSECDEDNDARLAIMLENYLPALIDEVSCRRETHYLVDFGGGRLGWMEKDVDLDNPIFIPGVSNYAYDGEMPEWLQEEIKAHLYQNAACVCEFVNTGIRSGAGLGGLDADFYAYGYYEIQLTCISTCSRQLWQHTSLTWADAKTAP